MALLSFAKSNCTIPSVYASSVISVEIFSGRVSASAGIGMNGEAVGLDGVVHTTDDICAGTSSNTCTRFTLPTI